MVISDVGYASEGGGGGDGDGDGGGLYNRLKTCPSSHS